MIEILLVLTTVVSMSVVWRMWKRIENLKRQNAILQKQLQEALEQLDKYENGKKSLQKLILGFVDLGVPGMVLAVAISISGYSGAAAITAALAALGFGFGMLGGIGCLLALVPATRYIRKVGFPFLFDGITQGLIAKGYSREHLRNEIGRYKFAPRRLRNKTIEVFDNSVRVPNNR
jgi:hypothetical protein